LTRIPFITQSIHFPDFNRSLRKARESIFDPDEDDLSKARVLEFLTDAGVIGGNMWSLITDNLSSKKEDRATYEAAMKSSKELVLVKDEDIEAVLQKLRGRLSELQSQGSSQLVPQAIPTIEDDDDDQEDEDDKAATDEDDEAADGEEQEEKDEFDGDDGDGFDDLGSDDEE
jgi:hypothetical protein